MTINIAILDEVLPDHAPTWATPVGFSRDPKGFAKGSHVLDIVGILKSPRLGQPFGLGGQVDWTCCPLYPESRPVSSATPNELCDALYAAAAIGPDLILIPATPIWVDQQVGSRMTSLLRELASRGVAVVVSSGNDSQLRSPSWCNSPACLPVVPLKQGGRPREEANLGLNFTKNGISAPGEVTYTLDSSGDSRVVSGSSAAAALVAAIVARIHQKFPAFSTVEIVSFIRRFSGPCDTAWVPPTIRVKETIAGMAKQSFA